MTLGVVGAVMFLPVASCSVGRSDVEQPAGSAQPPVPGSASVTAAPSTDSPVRRPPELDAGETLAGRRMVTTGNAEVEFAEGGKGDALIVAVRCQGEGTVEVAVRPVHVSFPVECLAGEVSTVYQQVAVSGVSRAGVVSVEAPTAVRWSLTVGRGAPDEEESPGAS
ncbi:hypothetical protein [Streptomyces sp. NPDC001091]